MSERSEAVDRGVIQDVAPAYQVKLGVTFDDVPRGYKSTELGAIPEDWEVCSLGNLGSFKNGINKSKPEFGHGYPFVNLMDVFGLPRTDSSTSDLGLVNTTQAERALYDVRAGDVLFVRSSVKPEGVGLTTYVPEDLYDTVFSGFLIRFRDFGKIFSAFKEHCFFEQGFRARLIAASSVSANTNISQSGLKSLKIALPQDKEEQRAIATALTDADALIESLDRLIAKKRAIKQAAMQQLLTGQTRLPGFSAPWETKRLGEIAEVEMGQSPSSAFYNTKEIGVPLIQGNADIVGRKTIKRIFTTQITKRGRCGDILLSVRAPVGEVSKATFDVCLGRGVCAIRYSNDFLFHFLVYLEPSWAKHSKGSTFDSVNSADVRTLEINFPQEEEQTAIATVFSDMDAEIETLERRRDKARQLKQGTMQQLLTGRVRLPVSC